MNKGTLLRLSFLLPLAFIFALQGCGGGGGGGGDDDNDNSNNTDVEDTTDVDDSTDDNSVSDLSSKIWMSSNCIQDSSGVYFKSLYEFKANGEVLQGYQDFQDTSCTTRKDETFLPSSLMTTYTKGASETLQDGANGYLITIAFNNVTVDGYYTITSQDNLCFTSNFSINTADFSYEIIPSAPIDYNNCLTVHSDANGQDPNPNPNPNPQNSDLLGMWWLQTLCYASDTGGTHNIILKFTEDNKVLYATLPYESNDCSGNPSTSSTFMEFNSPTTYSDLGETTLANGTLGHNLRFSYASAGTDDGYYIFNAQNHLCLSYNLSGFSNNYTTDIDYDNCMVKLNTDN
ncbi:MAG: hypothetical protein ABW124_15315 [Candidatus Thiodiazotropha sp. 6PLUC9]